MKFQVKDEMNTVSFDDSAVEDLKVEGDTIVFSFGGAVIKAKNSQNTRYQDMYCGAIELRLLEAAIVRLVKEGYKYYDANGNLQEEVPDEDVPKSSWQDALERCGGGRVFTLVEDETDTGFAYEFGVDVPNQKDEDKTDTYWLCIRFGHAILMWDRFCGPVDS